MKVVLDHTIPQALRPLLSGEHEVHTTKYLGWSDYEDHQLLTAAVEASFAALVTLDRSLPHQQETQASPLGIIVLDVHPTTPAHLKTHMDRVQKAVPRAGSDQSVIVLE